MSGADAPAGPAWPSLTARKGDVRPGHRPVGLPLPSTAPLTAAERGALDGLALAVDGLANRLRHAINVDRVDLALDAAGHAGHIGDLARRLGVELGRNR